MKRLFFILVYALFQRQVNSRTCKPGTLEYSENLCCYPVYDCEEDHIPTRCTENYGNETCESCKDGIQAFSSSSFDRKECYNTPDCKDNPDEVGINSTTCTCRWTSNQVHKKPESHLDILERLNCQFRQEHCQAGSEPDLFSDKCNECQPGYYKDKEGSSLCKRWKNCTLLGLEVVTQGSSMWDEECKGDNPATQAPAVSTPRQPIETTTKTTPFPSTTVEPPAENHSGLKAGVVVSIVAVVVVGIVIFCYFCGRKIRHKCKRGQNEETTERQENGNHLDPIGNHLDSKENEADPFIEPRTMETVLDSGNYPMSNGQLVDNSLPSTVSSHSNGVAGGGNVSHVIKNDSPKGHNSQNPRFNREAAGSGSRSVSRGDQSETNPDPSFNGASMEGNIDSPCDPLVSESQAELRTPNQNNYQSAKEKSRMDDIMDEHHQTPPKQLDCDPENTVPKSLPEEMAFRQNGDESTKDSSTEPETEATSVPLLAETCQQTVPKHPPDDFRPTCVARPEIQKSDISDEASVAKNISPASQTVPKPGPLKKQISLPMGPYSGTGGRPTAQVPPLRHHSWDNPTRQPEENSYQGSPPHDSPQATSNESSFPSHHYPTLHSDESSSSSEES